MAKQTRAEREKEVSEQYETVTDRLCTDKCESGSAFD